MGTAMPRMMPTGTNTFVSSHQSSSHPAPPHTAIPDNMVPMIDQPVSAPLPPRAGFVVRGRASPRGGRSSAIGATLSAVFRARFRAAVLGPSVTRTGRFGRGDVVEVAGPPPPQLDGTPEQCPRDDGEGERPPVEPAVLGQRAEHAEQHDRLDE